MRFDLAISGCQVSVFLNDQPLLPCYMQQSSLLMLGLSIVTAFLKIIRGYISQGALLVSLHPTEISGKKVVEGEDFFNFRPPQSL